MKITPNIELRKRLEKIYWNETRKTFILCRQSVVDRSEHVDPARLKEIVSELLNEKVMTDHLIEIWSKVGGRFAFDTYRVIFNAGLKKGKSKKAREFKADKLTDYQRMMAKYAYERSLQKARAIMTTEAEAINKVIDSVIERGVAEGLSIPHVRDLMKSELEGDTMLTIENWEAERIAVTEVGSAANTGSWEAMQEMGIEGIQKSWMGSGLPNMRESHIEYAGMEPQDLDYEYNTGLKFPQDPDCEIAEEVINCHCTPIWETDNI